VHEKDTFDHVLYLQASTFDAHVDAYDGPSSTDRHNGFVRSQEKVADFADVARAHGVLGADLLVHKVCYSQKRGMARRMPKLVAPRILDFLHL
jgi:hypothetical protein